MAILVPRWLDSSWQVRLQMCLKVCMVIFANRTRAQTRSAITLFADLSCCQGPDLGELGRGEPKSGPSHHLLVGVKSYHTVRLEAPSVAKFAILLCNFSNLAGAPKRTVG